MRHAMSSMGETYEGGGQGGNETVHRVSVKEKGRHSGMRWQENRRKDRKRRLFGDIPEDNWRSVRRCVKRVRRPGIK